MGKFKDFIRELRIFFGYIITRPFAETWLMIKTFYNATGVMDKPIFYVKLFGFATVFLIIVTANTKYYPPLVFMTILTFLALLRFEWISGRFRKWHVDRIKARAKKLAELEAKNGEHTK